MSLLTLLWKILRTIFPSLRPQESTAPATQRSVLPAQVTAKPSPSTTEVRAVRAKVTQERRDEQIREAKSLRDQGYSNTHIARRLGLSESSIRSLLGK